MSKLGEVFVKVLADTQEFGSSLRSGVNDALSDLSTQTGAVDAFGDRLQTGMRNAGQSMQNAGKTATTRLTAPLVGLASTALFTGARFDDQMARVRAASGATESEFAALREQAQMLGSTTRFSASEAGSAMEFLAFAGYDVNSMLSAMPGLLNTASVAGGDLASTADIISDTMGAFALDATETGRAADIFSQQFSQSNTSILQLGEAMKYAAPNAAAAGMTLEETSAALGRLGDLGLKGSIAGTTLAAVLRDLQSDSEKTVGTFDDLGVAVFDQDGQFRGLQTILGDLSTATADMTQEQRNAALSSIFTAASMKGANILMDEGVGVMEEYTEANENSAGAAEEMAGIMEDTLGGGFREVKSQMEGLLIDLSDVLVPVMREQVIPAVQRFGDWVKGLIERFRELDPQQQKIIGGVVALVAAIGPALVVIGGLFKVFALAVPVITGIVNVFLGLWRVIKLVGYAFKILSMLLAANPFVLIIVAVVAVIAIVWHFREQIMEAIGKAWDWITEKFTAFKDWFVESVSGMVDSVVEFFQNLWDGIVEAVRAAIDWVKENWPLILAILTGPIGLAVKFIVDNWDKIRKFIKVTVERIKQKVSDVFGRMVDWVKNLFQTWRDWVTGLWDRLKTSLSNAASSIRDTVTGAFQRIVDGVREKLNTVMEFVTGLPRRILNGLGNLGNLLKNAGRDILNGLWNGMKDKWNDLTGWVGGLGSRIRDLKGPLSYDRVMLTDIGEAIIGGLGKGMEKEWKSVESMLGGMTASIPVTAEAAAFGQARTGLPNLNGRQESGISIQMTVNNPLPETSADSASRELRKLAAIGVFGD